MHTYIVLSEKLTIQQTRKLDLIYERSKVLHLVVLSVYR